MTIAGSTCVDWSSMGRRAGLSGRSNLAFIIWLNEVVHREPAILIHECTPQFPPALLRARLPSPYMVMSVVIGPDHFGVPVTRDRIFTIAIHQHKLVCKVDLQKFLHVMGVKLVMHGGMYWVQGEHADKELKRRASEQCIVPDGAQKVDWSETLPPWKKLWLEQYRNYVSEKRCLAGLRQHDDPAVGKTEPDPFIFDLEHNPLKVPRCSSKTLPCMLTHGEFWCDAPGVRRPLVKEEILSVAGVPSLAQHYAPGELVFKRLLPTMSIGQVTHLAGNSMHLCVVGNLMMWVLANCVLPTPPSPTADRRLFDNIDLLSGSELSISDAEETQDESAMAPTESDAKRRKKLWGLIG